MYIRLSEDFLKFLGIICSATLLTTEAFKQNNVCSHLLFLHLHFYLSDAIQMGQGVKLRIQLCETDNWISLSFLNERCRNVCRTVPVTTVNIPERNRGLFWLLSATAVTTPVGCRFEACLPGNESQK